MMKRSWLPSALALAFSVLGLPAIAQQILTVPAPQFSVAFGKSVVALDDVDGDGVPDFGVGDPERGVPKFGIARVYSGADGSLIHEWLGEAHEDRFGGSMARVGDINGDGRCEIAVGAELHDSGGTSSGRVYIYSGIDGSLLTTCDGESSGDRFGFSIDGGSDLNGDGVPDLVVGASQNDEAGSNAGKIYAISGADYSVIFSALGEASNDRLGFSVAIAGDVDGDGTEDVIAGAPRHDDGGPDSGRAYVFLAPSGAVHHVFGSSADDEEVGYDVDGLGDIDGDGLSDLLVGTDSDTAYVYRGGDGSLAYPVWGQQASAEFGTRVTGLGDVDGDGDGDFAISSHRWDSSGNDNAGRVYLYSGGGGFLIQCLEGAPGSQFGLAIAGERDFDGDGRNDLLATTDSNAAGVTLFAAPILALPPFATSSILKLCDQGGFAKAIGDINGDGVKDFQTAVEGPAGNEAIRAHSGVDGRVLRQWSHSSLIAVFDIGDVDADGCDDIALAMRRPGYEYELRSGQDDSLINTLLPLHPNFGITIRPMGDVDSDGRGDLLLAQRLSLGSFEYASGIFSADDGSLIQELESSILQLGIEPCGDVDADGVNDVLIGERLGYQQYIRRIYSGADGSILWASPLSVRGGWLPRGGGGDVNNDGHADLLLYTQLGTFDMFSGATGHFLYQVSHPGAHRPMWIGDVDFDGADDFVLEELQGVRVVSGASGSTLVVYGTPDPSPSNFQFGFVSHLGDSDGDGVSELIINGPEASYFVPLPAYLGSCALGVAAITINGSQTPISGVVELGLGEAFTLGVTQGSGANFIIFGQLGSVVAAATVSLPFGLSMCFSPSFLEPSNPNLFLLANSFDPNSPQALLPSTPTPWSWSLGSGIPLALDVAFQGFILTGPGTLQRTNGVQLRVR